MKRGRERMAFTVIELLVVIAVIAVLAAVLLPVLAGARKSGRKAVAISNLYQCYLSMMIYIQDEKFPASLPRKDALEAHLGNAITCDPSDMWRIGCTAPFTPWTVGSFGYVRESMKFSNPTLDCDEGCLQSYSEISPLPLLISPFYDRAIARVDAQPMSPRTVAPDLEQYRLPETALTLWADGQIAMSKLSGRHANDLFTWSSLFFDVRRGRPSEG